MNRALVRRTLPFPLPRRGGGGQGEGEREEALARIAAQFPLTPALSPSKGERENRRPPVRQTSAVVFFEES